MAETWGDIIGRNYGMGRAIGDDFAASRFSKKAQAVKDEYEQRAATEGKNIEDYLPEIEQRLESLAVDTGATRRNITRGGKALDREFAGRISEDASRGGERRAGTAALAGDQAGARDIRARTQYAIGEFDAGQDQQIAGDTIRATKGAIAADGTYDAAKGSQALAQTAAQYGDAGAAAGNQQNAQTFRLKAAVAKGDNLANIVQNLDQFDNDQLRGAWLGFVQNVPELKHIDVQKGDSGEIVIYTGGKPSGSVTPGEAMQLIGQFTKQPGEVVQGYMASRLKAIEEEKAQKTEFSGKIDDAMIKAVGDMTAAGIPDGVATKLAAASTGTGESGGWQLQEIGDQPGNYMVQKGGDVYRIRTNVSPDAKTGLGGGAFLVETLDGQPVNPAMLNAGDRKGIAYSMSALGDVMKLGNAQQIELAKAKISALATMRASRFGEPMPQASGGGGWNESSMTPAERELNAGSEAKAQIKQIEADLGRPLSEQEKVQIQTGDFTIPLPPVPGSPAALKSGPASAPAAQTALPKKAAISAEYVGGEGRQQVLQLRDDYIQKRDALARFEQDFPAEPGVVPGGRFAMAQGRNMTSMRQRTPEQQLVGDRLRAEAAEAEQKLRAATADLRSATGALQRDTAASQTNRAAEDLYGRYSSGSKGMADFTRALSSP